MDAFQQHERQIFAAGAHENNPLVVIHAL